MPEQQQNRSKYASRKFIMAVLAQAINLTMILTKNIAPNDGMNYVVYITAIYVFGEAFKDAGFLKNGVLERVLTILLGTNGKGNGKGGK